MTTKTPTTAWAHLPNARHIDRILADLKGRRAEAIVHYRAALAIDSNGPMRHDQFRITIDRAWVEERLAAEEARHRQEGPVAGRRPAARAARKPEAR